MRFAHAATSEPDRTDTAGDMRRLRRRGHIATGIGGAGYISTLIAAIADSDPRDGDIIAGIEVAFAGIAIIGVLSVFILRIIWEFQRETERWASDEFLSMFRLGRDVADTYPRRPGPPAPDTNIR